MTYTNPQAEKDLPNTTQLMQRAFGVVSQFAPVVTSVMGDHGVHVEHSAHYDGRAIDVGAFGGTPVGFNRPTWDALVAAIASGQFQKIGTLKELVTNPQLRALAEQNGVVLFEDDAATGATGPHVHFQVGE